ncbi:MAG: hypothetical protein JRH20_04610 [Deltaproteobacteria bacterium]|nr:hypothetical protein [Deltaproteobacteria bacterium]
MRIFSSDGAAGITVLESTGDFLQGSIPPEIGQLKNLQDLQLHRNEFIGSIPSELGQLSKLKNLRLDRNQLTDSEPGAFSGLLAIDYINVRENQLTQQAVDSIINDIYQDRGKHMSWRKDLYLNFDNAAPSQTGCVQMNDLNTNYGWMIYTEGC